MRYQGTAYTPPTQRPAKAWMHRVLEASPSRVVIGVFLILTTIPTLLLMHPHAAASGKATPFPDALFTAVSAVSVTGLSTVDMGSHWSPFGELVVVMAFQIGGIGALTLASILALIVTRKLGLRQRMLVASDTNLYGPNPRNLTGDKQAIGFGDVGSLLWSVALSLIVIEATLTALIFPRLMVEGMSFPHALWNGYYLAASSFTNTGFVPFSDGLTAFETDPYMLGVLSVGVFLGSIGFPVIFALYRYVVKGGWKAHRRLSLHAKLTLITSLILIIFGWILIGSLEWNNEATLATLSAGDAIMSSGYTSIMTRSGGLGILDTANMNGSTMLIIDMLMFVGGGSASTAGGIKVTTLAVLFLAAYAEARGNEDMQAFGRRIPVQMLRLAVSIVIWGATLVITSSVIILHITDAPLDHVLLEVISAFGTCGLSTGLSETLPPAGKIVLAATMWAGRVGTVTLAAAVASTSRKTFYRFPEERPIVG